MVDVEHHPLHVAAGRQRVARRIEPVLDRDLLQVAARLRRPLRRPPEPGRSRHENDRRERTEPPPAPRKERVEPGGAEERDPRRPDVEGEDGDQRGGEPPPPRAIGVLLVRTLEGDERDQRDCHVAQVGQHPVGVDAKHRVEAEEPHRGRGRPPGHGLVAARERPQGPQGDGAGDHRLDLEADHLAAKDPVERHEEEREAGRQDGLDGRGRIDQVHVTPAGGERLRERVVRDVVAAGEQVRVEDRERDRHRDRASRDRPRARRRRPGGPLHSPAPASLRADSRRSI